MTDPADHAAHAALALERATNALDDIEALTKSVAELRKEMHEGFTELKTHFKTIELRDAQRSGAERLGARLLGALGVLGGIGATIGGICATIWAAVHNNPPHH